MQPEDVYIYIYMCGVYLQLGNQKEPKEVYKELIGIKRNLQPRGISKQQTGIKRKLKSHK